MKHLVITISQSWKRAAHCFLCPTNIPKTKDSSFTVMNDKEKQHILKFKKLKPANICYFCLKITETINWLSKFWLISDWFSFFWLTY